jgi:hypothetical protein
MSHNAGVTGAEKKDFGTSELMQLLSDNID